jgi:1,5-anhydro-D-fructose reductase (1,5-anhydro-D-mannitol-forming)
MKVIKWGMIGVGAVTAFKSAPAYRHVQGSSLVAVAARRAESAADYARRHGIDLVFDTAEDLIASPDVEAVYIASPPTTHFNYAMLTAATGKPCCVEKPMAMSFAQAKMMNAAFEAAGQPLFVAYYRRSLPRFGQVATWIREGLIGDIRHINWTLARPPNASDIAGQTHWRIDPTEAPGGYFDDLACHGLDLFDFLLGPIQSASGNPTNQGGHYNVLDAVAASWIHETGVTGTASWNFGSFKRVDEVRIDGSAGQIRFPIFDDAPLSLETASETRTIEIANPDPVQLHHVENIVRHLTGKGQHPSTGTSAARTALVMEQILQGI